MTTPADLAQRQLDAYNDHDLEAFLDCYHPEVEVRDFPSGELRIAGQPAMRERYGPLFERPDLHADLIGRLSLGRVVMDQERVRGLRDDGEVRAIAIYEVEGEHIRNVWFVREDEA